MTYVMADIHGNEARFRSVLRQIRLRPEDTLYVLGDVIDRHPGGIRILRQIMGMPNAKMLLGNHEYMMLRALGHPYDDNTDDGRAMAHWYRNGGDVTHFQWKRNRKTSRERMVAYLRNLPLCYRIEVGGRPYLLVHAAPVEAYDADPKYRNPTHFAVWKRWDIRETWEGKEILVFGHTPTAHYRDVSPMEIWYRDRRVGIDCGSGYPDGSNGRLACLRLDDGAVFYSRDEIN